MNQILDKIELYKTGSVISGSSTPGTGSIFTSGSIPDLFYKNTNGTIYKLSSTSSYFNIIEYTSSGQWLKPSNVKYIRVVAVSAGGSGGSGGFGISPAGGTVTGGCGGAGGGTIIEFFSSASLPDGIYNITIGTGGPAQAGRTTPGIGGNGNQGTQTVFATGSTIILRPFSGNGGSNGNTFAASEIGGASDRGVVTPNTTAWPNYVYGAGGASIGAATSRVTSVSDVVNMFSVWPYRMGGGGSGGHMSASGIFVNLHRATSGSNIQYLNGVINTNTPGQWGLGTNAQTIVSDLPLYILLQISGSIPNYTPIGYLSGGGAGGGSGDLAGTIGGGSGSAGGIGCGGGGGGGTVGIRAGGSGRGGNGYLAIIEYY